MIVQRHFHSSCILGNFLYVYGGNNECDDIDVAGSILSIERLAVVNEGNDKAADCWESLKIFAKEKLLPLMMPLKHE